MSRIGKKPIPVPSGVTLTVNGQELVAKGPKGERSYVVNDAVKVSVNDNQVTVEPVDNSKASRSQWGTSRTQVANLFDGVTTEFSKSLTLVGVGYRAQMKGSVLNLALGYSHDIDFPVPDGLKIATPKPTEIVITGINKQQVGQAAAEIRAFRPPEPYKGKGVKYSDEYIFRKEGKKK